MGRRWIMVELGEHCLTHIIPRLKKVVDGADPGGITEAVGWKGGGGFRYYRLAPSLLEKDKWGQWVISKEFNAAMLAEAVCKLEGFTYAPSDTIYWQHGHSTERDFIYVTTQHLSADQLARDRHDVAPVERGVHTSAARAAASCSTTRARAVPPAEIFDSTHAWILPPWLCKGLGQGGIWNSVMTGPTSGTLTLTKWDVNRIFELTPVSPMTVLMPPIASVNWSVSGVPESSPSTGAAVPKVPAR